MSVLQQAELLRVKANSKLNPKVKSTLGQFFTPHPISLYMASLFHKIKGEVSLLDPGCGSGSLTAAFVDESLRRKKISSINIHAFDLDPVIEPFIDETLSLCIEKCKKHDVSINANFILDDFIFNKTKNSGLFARQESSYSHVIMNPPYKKIASTSNHRKALDKVGISTVNLYTGFVALALRHLKEGGELVAIIPRSFCNGLYYQPFREFILHETAIKHIHIFDSRSQAFADNDVLQENIIIHLIKGVKQQEVTITSSPIADFEIDESTQSITATDQTIRTVPFTAIVKSNDKGRFIHIAANERDQAVIDRLSFFNSTLSDIGLQVSTGAVVDFRLKADLRPDIETGAVPLIYPTHLNGGVNWPKDSKKPNAISVSNKSRSWLWENLGDFVIAKRFTSKEEKRRIVAAHYDGSLPSELIGFDNKLNVFHNFKQGFAKDVALGLYVYLNSTLLDKYYRLFGGHTQVNATDLRAIRYPDLESLKLMGNRVLSREQTSQCWQCALPVSWLSQKQIDEILEEQLAKMAGNDNNPLTTQEKIDQALEILALLGMPKAQQNERSALTLLSLIALKPNDSWADLKRPMIGVTPIMNWCEEFYGKKYAPNTRETFRRQTLHQFITGGLCLYNPDKPDRPVNSPKACYQITTELFDVLVKYDTDEWEPSLADWLKLRPTLITQYAKEREMEMIPLILDDDTEIKLSPGGHSQLIRDIVTQFGPRFAPGSEVIYLGDTGAKEDFFRRERLAELGVTVDRKGKLPDVILYWFEKDWLLLIESVTSHGAVDSKRHNELSTLFAEANPGLIYVTAFPDRKTMAKYLADISWETEVWTADAPTHMIHFNGDRFLSPHEK